MNKLTECERLEIVYDALSMGPCDIKSFLRIFKDHGEDVSEKEIKELIQTLSKTEKVTRSDGIIKLFSVKVDEYQDLLQSIERMKVLKEFKGLNQLKILKRIYEKEATNYTEILIEQLLKFDTDILENYYPWNSYILFEGSIDGLKSILTASPSLDGLITSESVYQFVKSKMIFELGLPDDYFPEKSPYNLVDIIWKRRHPIYSYIDQKLRWKGSER